MVVVFQCGLCVDSSCAGVWWLCFSVACVLTVAVLCGGCVSVWPVLTVAVLVCGGCVSLWAMY